MWRRGWRAGGAGVRFPIGDHGEGRAVSSTVVFIHGSGRAGSANWPSQVASFADSVFLTMPGYGDESPVPTHMSDWISRVLDVDGELDLVAHSYGGLAAILAAQASERVRSLTLFEPARLRICPRSTKCGGDDRANDTDRRRGPPLAGDRLRRHVHHGSDRLAAPAVRRSFRHPRGREEPFARPSVVVRPAYRGAVRCANGGSHWGLERGV